MTAANALYYGDCLAQVASQTLRNIDVIDQAAATPILRPIVGMDKPEIIAQAKAIGSFKTAILPDEDCCSLFAPRSVSTAVTPDEIAAREARLDVDALVAEAAAAAEAHDLACAPPRRARQPPQASGARMSGGQTYAKVSVSDPQPMAISRRAARGESMPKARGRAQRLRRAQKPRRAG